MSRTIFAGGHIDFDDGEIRIMLAGEGGETMEDIRRRARAVQKRAQRQAPVQTGELRRTISIHTFSDSDGAKAEVTADAPHALFVEFGRRAINLTGSKHYLNWIGDSGDNVFTQKARAVPAVHFMRDALDDARD